MEQLRQSRLYKGHDISVPGKLNIVIALFSYASAIGCLALASQYLDSHGFWYVLPFAIAFSFIGNTLFSLLHESVHRSFHANVALNDWFGRVSAAFFPTGFTFQRACHLGHHKRNRTDVEMFELYYPTDNKLLKRFQLYTVLTGIYWTQPLTGCLLYLFFPWALDMKWLRSKDSHSIRALSADAMLSGVEKSNPWIVRSEILFTLTFQLGLCWIFGISFYAWILCYWAFALNWGALQYTDHAWSARDIRNGAWNLKVHPWIRWIFLNYHHHLAHHQHPHVSWIHLPKFVDPNSEQPSFLRIYLKLWKGPTLTQEPPPPAIDKEFESLIYN
jgi:fatty acid desaturase